MVFLYICIKYEHVETKHIRQDTIFGGMSIGLLSILSIYWLEYKHWSWIAVVEDILRLWVNNRVLNKNHVFCFV